MRVLRVYGEDYAALRFQEEHGGKTVKEIIDNLDLYQDEDWYLKVFETGDVSNEFMEWLRSNHLDYDDTKHNMIYLETETVPNE